MISVKFLKSCHGGTISLIFYNEIVPTSHDLSRMGINFVLPILKISKRNCTRMEKKPRVSSYIYKLILTWLKFILTRQNISFTFLNY